MSCELVKELENEDKMSAKKVVRDNQGDGA